MTLSVYHHPFSRAANMVWALEEVGAPYALRFVDILAGTEAKAELRAANPMGKVPTLVDGDVVVTEAAAISLYLADRYAPGRLAPAQDDPRRATYLRWSFFAPSVVEPAVIAKAQSWSFRESSVGWGNFDAMLVALRGAVEGGFVLGDTFSMADVVLGSTLRSLLRFGMLEAEPVFTAYVERLAARPALQRADARNAQVIEERGLTPM
ncbi:MAG: glutathione S-transferase family protein [Myxococcota bacterium]